MVVVSKWMCATCGVVDSTCECEPVPDLVDVTHVYRAGQEEKRQAAADKATAMFPAMPSLAIEIMRLPLEGDDD